MRTALALLDTQTGRLARYVRAPKGHVLPVLRTDTVRLDPWDRVLAKEIGVDREAIEQFRQTSGAFAEPDDGPVAA